MRNCYRDGSWTTTPTPAPTTTPTPAPTTTPTPAPTTTPTPAPTTTPTPAPTTTPDPGPTTTPDPGSPGLLCSICTSTPVPNSPAPEPYSASYVPTIVGGESADEVSTYFAFLNLPI